MLDALSAHRVSSIRLKVSSVVARPHRCHCNQEPVLAVRQAVVGASRLPAEMVSSCMRRLCRDMESCTELVQSCRMSQDGSPRTRGGSRDNHSMMVAYRAKLGCDIHWIRLHLLHQGSGEAVDR